MTVGLSATLVVVPKEVAKPVNRQTLELALQALASGPAARGFDRDDDVAQVHAFAGWVIGSG